jgi:hypothetical protein
MSSLMSCKPAIAIPLPCGFSSSSFPFSFTILSLSPSLVLFLLALLYFLVPSLVYGFAPCILFFLLYIVPSLVVFLLLLFFYTGTDVLRFGLLEVQSRVQSVICCSNYWSLRSFLMSHCLIALRLNWLKLAVTSLLSCCFESANSVVRVTYT